MPLFLHKGVTEKLGTSVEAFASMIAFVQDILGNAQGDVPEVCFTFAAALVDARDASAQHVAIIHRSQPFQSFFRTSFLLTCKHYVAIVTTFLATWN